MWSVVDGWWLKAVGLAVLTLSVVAFSDTSAQAEKKPVRVKFTTTMGDIVLELYPDKAPVTVDNFLKYVKDGFYKGTVFHRVKDGFMIQGGGYDANLNEKPTRPPIKNEADNGLKNEPYTIAMARTSDPHSATSQFFINVADNKFLNHKAQNMAGWGYAVFGKVVEGKEVVDKIKALPTAPQGMHENVPTTPVTITVTAIVAM